VESITVNEFTGVLLRVVFENIKIWWMVFKSQIISEERNIDADFVTGTKGCPEIDKGHTSREI
jgi:hypothetical protein